MVFGVEGGFGEEGAVVTVGCYDEVAGEMFTVGEDDSAGAEEVLCDFTVDTHFCSSLKGVLVENVVEDGSVDEDVRCSVLTLEFSEGDAAEDTSMLSVADIHVRW